MGALKRLLCYLCAMLLMPALALAAEAKVTAGGPVVGFSENSITITAPFDGVATVTVEDEWNVYRTETYVVREGKNTLTWDGLGDCEQRLPTGKCTLRAVIAGAQGLAEAETTIQVNKPKQAVIFALSNADTLYLDHADEWLVEVKLVREGKVTVDICRAEEPDKPLETRRVTLGSGIHEISWDGKVKGADVQPGAYLLRYYAEETPAYAREVRVSVAAEKPTPAIGITDRLLPERGMSDAEIWQIMMEPSIVLDVKNTKDYEVRSEPGKNAGKMLGTVHGQSQGLALLEITANGYARVGAWNHETSDFMEGYVEAAKLKLVYPRKEYGLLLDKAEQTLTLFCEGERIATMPVSTGLVSKGQMIRETAAGAFLLQEHMADFSNKGYTYGCVIRYDGGNLLHQVGYKKQSDRADYSDQAGLLGMKASHGCVRMPAAPESGVNAYWLWTHLPAGTRLLILDDEAQRTWEARVVAGKVDDVRPEAPPALEEGETELLITLGGDAVLGTREKWWKDGSAFPAYLEQNGLGYPFEGLQSIFSADDLTFINLECVLKADSAGEVKDKEYRFRGLPEYAQVLNEGSVELVNIANNHYIDYGTKGRDATRQALEAAGVSYSGYGYVYVWEKDGHKIGFAGCRETTYKSDRDVIRRDVAALRRAGCEVVIYSCHWGKEYSASHNDMQEEMAREAMLAGVDILVGAHPHVVQGVASAGGTVVLWSLGNLMFGGTHDMSTFDATLGFLRLRFREGEYVGCTVSCIPILTSSSAPANDFHPIIASGQDRERILQKIQADTPFELMEEMYFPAR